MTSATFTIDGTTFAAPPLPAGLHVVATPIGNLGDITLRALKTLAAADLVCAEDTRHTGRLLSHYGITRPLMRYDEHSGERSRPKILDELGQGGAVALVSDAGTPLLSDPGYRLVEAARSADLPVHAVPGASAVVAALSVAGLPTDAFHFAGFLPQKAGARRSKVAALRSVEATLVFYEAPHRLAATLEDLSAELGPRRAAVARELTKKFETVSLGSLPDLAQEFGEGTKGEIVILVSPPHGPASNLEPADADVLLAEALTRLSPSAAAAEVARASGLARRDLYARAMELKAQRD
ncbi:MAG: 16S rRNA (cytidine(1402)-2'-O)-methyltransferase [Pseudomonadota bacterium]